MLGSRVNGKVKIHMDGNGVYRDLVQYSKPQRKQMDFNDLKRLNSISLCIAITVLCLPGAFLGVRSLLPVPIQNDFYHFMLRHPSIGNFVTYLSFVVGGLGVEMCALAAGLFVILLFFRGVPGWLKGALALHIWAAVLGVIAVRHPVGK